MKYQSLHPLGEWQGLVMQVRRIDGRLFAIGGLGADGQIVRSDDEGRTWTAVDWQGTVGRGAWKASMPATGQHGLRHIWGESSAERSDARKKPSLHAVGEYGTILSSLDAGATWRAERVSCNGCLFGVIGRGAALYASGDDGIRRRPRSGKAWKKIDDTKDLCRMWRVGDDLIAIGDHGVMLRIDADDIVTRLRTGTEDALFGFLALDASRWLAVGHQGLVIVTEDAGASFQRVPVDVAHDLFAVVPAGPELVIAVGHKGTVLASTSGRRWQVMPAPKKGVDLWGAWADGDGVLIAGAGGHVWRATL